MSETRSEQQEKEQLDHIGAIMTPQEQDNGSTTRPMQMPSLMYDLTDDDEAGLPLPEQWTRSMDLSGEVRYKNLKFGSESEEHPYIIQALNAARRLPLPEGWIVKKTITTPAHISTNSPGLREETEGEEDFFFCEVATGRSGWDPPQLRACLGTILRRDGFSQAADRVTLHLDPLAAALEQEQDEAREREDSKPEQIREQSQDETSDPPSDTDTEKGEGGGSTSSFVDWAKLRQSLEGGGGGGGGGERGDVGDAYDEHDNEEDYRYEEEDYERGGRSQYPSSVASTKSRRSQKWQDIKRHQREEAQRLHKNVITNTPSSSKQHRRPGAVTQHSVRTVAASVLEDNERVHVLLMELRGMFASRRGLTCHFLYASDLDLVITEGGSNSRSGQSMYSQESVNNLLRLGGNLAGLILGQPALVVRAIAALEQQQAPDGSGERGHSGEVDLMVYIVLHRVLHPFSADNSRTTALLLEALNYQIDECPWDPENEKDRDGDDGENPWYDAQSVADTAGVHTLYSCDQSRASRVQRHVKVPACNSQHELLCMLLLGVRDGRHVARHFWTPLHRPFLRDYSYTEETGESSPSPLPPPPPECFYHETVLTTLLKSYGMRRDVSLFYRMVWKQVLPALAGAIEGGGEGGEGFERGRNINSASNPMSSFPQLISLASRIIESALLDEVSVIFPATATAVARCLAETCGQDGLYTYLLNFLLLPNLVKLLLGDNDCAENEDVYKQTLLNSLANKYFNYHEWWPKSTSFVENKKSKKLRVTDVAGVLIWCVWRIFTCAVYTDPVELTTFSAAKFFANIGVNETYTEVADTRIRNVVTRMRLKIRKGCECLLQLPLDVQGSEFLELHSSAVNGARVKIHTKSMGALLHKRINDLMLKPQEMLNAMVISRHDSIVIFDALAFVLEELQQQRGRGLGPDTDTDEDEYEEFAGEGGWLPPEDLDVEEVLLDIQDYLGLCDAMDQQVLDEVEARNRGGVEAEDLEVEDVMLLWTEPLPREEADRRIDYDGDEQGEHSYYNGGAGDSVGGDGDSDGDQSYRSGGGERQVRPPFKEQEQEGGGGEYMPPPHMLPPYPYEDDAYHSQQQQQHYGEGGIHDDDDFLDDVTMFSDIPPPPPPHMYGEGGLRRQLEHQHEQLCRGASLQQRYLSALQAMLRRVRVGAPCSLTALVANDAWFYSPEVDISHRLAVQYGNIFDKVTSSSLGKSKPNAHGALLPRDVNPRAGEGGGDYAGLAVTQKNFFNSLRFSDSRSRASTRTSVDININRNAPRLVNNMLRESLITKHDTGQGQGFQGNKDYEKIYLSSHARSDPLHASKQGQQGHHRPQPRYTKVTLPENSPLLVPTVSLCCKPAARQPHSKIHKSFINSLRGSLAPSHGDKKGGKGLQQKRKRRVPNVAAISPTRPLLAFPDHLRGRVRGHNTEEDDGGGEHGTTGSAVLDRSLQRQNSLFSAADNNHSDYYEQHKQSGRNNFHGFGKRLNQYGRGKYSSDNVVQSKVKERKMPTPVHSGGGAQDSNLFAATISRSLKLEMDDGDDCVITAEQERGWMAQLRSWEARDGSDAGGYPRGSVQRKPFFPSGHVEPVRLRNQQRRVPEHLTPGKNRRRRNSSSRSSYGSTGQHQTQNQRWGDPRGGSMDWYDYRQDHDVGGDRDDSDGARRERERGSHGGEAYTSYEDILKRQEKQWEGKREEGREDQQQQQWEQLSPVQEGGQRGELMDMFPLGDSKQLGNTLNLLRQQARGQGHGQEMKREGGRGEEEEGDESSSLSSADTPLPSPVKTNNGGRGKGEEEDPVLQEASRKTEGVLARLQRRVELQKLQQQKKKLQLEKEAKLQEEQQEKLKVQKMREHEQEQAQQGAQENNENDKNVDNFSGKAASTSLSPTAQTTINAPPPGPLSASTPVKSSAPPRPPLLSSPSAYSLKMTDDAAEKDSPSLLRDKPRRLLSHQDPPVYTPEEEQRHADEFAKHERKCAALSPADIHARVVARKQQHDEEEGEEEGGEGGQEGRTSPEPGGSSPHHDTAPAIPVIAKQHSVSSLAKREKLMEGYEVTKHADVGYGKKKLLQYEPSGQKLQWRPLKGAGGGSSSSLFSSLSRRMSNKKLSEGGEGGGGVVKNILLRDIIEVRRGVESSALRKAGLLDPLCCLSIVTNQLKDHKPRTLDLVFMNKSDRDSFVRGLEVLLQQLSHHSVQFI